MKSIKNFLFAAILFVLASCTGGNESSVGKAEFWDYLPSIFMSIGTVILIIAAVTFYKGKKLGDRTDKGISTIRTAGWIAVVGGIIFIFGLATYFGS